MKTEKILALLFLISLFFISMHWPGGNILLILSLMFLTIIYFPFAFYFFSGKTFKNQNFAVSIIFGWLLSIVLIGIMFKLMFWPGNQIMILGGCVTAPFLLIAAFILFRNAREDLKTYYKNLLIRTTVLTIVIFVILVIPIKALIQFQSNGDQERARLMLLHYTTPENEFYKKQLEDYKVKKDSILDSQNR